MKVFFCLTKEFLVLSFELRYAVVVYLLNVWLAFMQNSDFYPKLLVWDKKLLNMVHTVSIDI